MTKINPLTELQAHIEASAIEKSENIPMRLIIVIE